MNSREWEILEVDQNTLQKLSENYNGETGEDGVFFGSTYHHIQKIYLWKELCLEQKKQTLLHELMHCYIECFISGAKSYDEEALCNISSCSHDVIHEIVENYFQKK